MPCQSFHNDWSKPGYIATPQTAPLREKQPDGSRHPFDQLIIAKTPAARWGTPDDLKGPAVFLASDAYTFAQVNDGNAVAMTFALKNGWGQELKRVHSPASTSRSISSPTPPTRLSSPRSRGSWGCNRTTHRS